MTQADNQRASAMVARIRSMPVAPYTEGTYVLRVLDVTGRTSGEVRSTAIAVPQLHDRRYLCAPNRTRDWVRNLLAAGTCRLAADEPEYRASLVDAAEGAPVLDLYLGQLGRVSEEWPFEAGAALDEISENWDTMAVFRLETV